MAKKQHMLQVRISDDDYEVLRTLAETANISMSSLVRDHIGRISVRNRNDERERIVMLNRINANLNMIARWVNTHKSAASAVEVVSHLIAIERHVQEMAR
ncbi:TPA: MobC family plasmid mobilization relaxosome protein [Salmonella enterica]|nr:MobC family plasmid mobilization relaxosome protein [Salmonella enterica]